MKALLVVVFVQIATAPLPREDYVMFKQHLVETPELCQELANRWNHGAGEAPGGQTNTPGARYLKWAWCEDPTAPWPE